MKTLASMFRAFAFVLHQMWLSSQKPYLMKLARWNLWSWGFVTLCAVISLGSEVASVYFHGGWWSWWYLWHVTLLGCDLIMFRAAVIGYFYRKTQDAEDAAFVDIIVHGYSKQP